MSEDAEQRKWHLSDIDRDVLWRISKSLRKTAALARRGNHYIALGEAWEAIDQILEGQEVDINVGISVGFRRGDREAEEGLFGCLRINNEEIILDELSTTYSRDVGSDHFTKRYACLLPDEAFDVVQVEEWFSKLEEIMSFDDARLTVERDHI